MRLSPSLSLPEKREIDTVIDDCNSFFICHLRHNYQLDHMKSKATEILERASDILDLSDLSSSSPSLPPLSLTKAANTIPLLHNTNPKHKLSFHLPPSTTLSSSSSKRGSVTLLNGVEMPLVGFGTWRLEEGECVGVVRRALELGYRRFDTALVYGTESCLGEAISTFPEKQKLFITTKIPEDQFGDINHVRKIVKEQMERLGREKIDMFMLHSPGRDAGLRRSTWQALETLYDEGLFWSLGVSNADINEMNDILSFARIKPHMLQNKYDFYHPGTQMITGRYEERWHDIPLFCKNNGIVFESYSSLSAWPYSLRASNDPIVQIIAKQHKKTPSQIVLRGLVQSNIAVIPRSTKPSHMKSNLEIFDFELSNEEMALLYSLRYFVTSPLFAAPSHAVNVFGLKTEMPEEVDAGFCGNPNLRQISFVYSCDRPEPNPELFWIGHEGDQHFLGTIGTNEPLQIDSYVGHVFESNGNYFRVATD
eukprot:CAMPEP_0201492140 /NCGR_PEP_ID=MMETSP0151_2-20130828/32098_1 /ASSEMBLY_ACC=CAM_ASM_000257 /TAXON_ID=200890 /ORGANISM="Paramoeba atlantica, Strain 621/1 / CCAP 1560/9" /LENGTH=479 /DNA_ID=CAMNT_0047878807 /DNA_START=306 /DNA_END=1742 /DNA_ORIENTATION=+